MTSLDPGFTTTLPRRAALLRRSSWAITHAPYAPALTWTERIADRWWTSSTDAFHTNSHFNVTAIASAEAWVSAIALRSPP